MFSQDNIAPKKLYFKIRWLWSQNEWLLSYIQFHHSVCCQDTWRHSTTVTCWSVMDVSWHSNCKSIASMSVLTADEVPPTVCEFGIFSSRENGLFWIGIIKEIHLLSLWKQDLSSQAEIMPRDNIEIHF